MPQQVVATLRAHQECTIGGAAVSEQLVDWTGPCDYARISGVAYVWQCWGHSACTKIGYEVDGRKVFEFSREVQPWEGTVTIPIEHTISCDYIRRKTHKLWAAGCYTTSVWDVDVTLDVIAVWGERPPQPSPPSPPAPSPPPDWTRWLPWVLVAVIALAIFMMVWSGMMVAVVARRAAPGAAAR
jgi:hypothetical protein